MNFSYGEFKVVTLDKIRSTAVAWDAFNSHFRLQCDYLAALEAANPPDMQFRYVFIYKREKLVGCAYLQIVEYSEKNFSGNGNAWYIPLLKLIFKIKKVRLVFCGNLFSVDYPCLHFLEESISFEKVISILKEVTKQEKGQLLLLKEMNLPAEKIDVLKNNGFRHYGEDLTMKLEIANSWNSFEDYFNALSKKYRKRLKLIRKSKSELSVRTLEPEETISYLDRIGELFRQTSSRQFLKMGIIDEKYFLEMQKVYGRKFFINGYFLEEKLIAFASHIEYEDTLEIHYIGIDYSYNETYQVYFNILYDGVEMGIAMKKKYLELGRTAREAKASVGCKPSPSFDYLFANKTIRFMISVFEKIFLDKMGEGWKNRNPFKSTESVK